MISSIIRNYGLKLNVACEVVSYALLADALLHTNLIETVPVRIFEAIPNRSKLKVFELPFDVEPFDVGLFWSSTFDNDIEHRWFREIVQEQFQQHG